jgi:CheY-like chemotaxis protein
MGSHFNLALIPERAESYFEQNRNVLIVEDDRILGEMVKETLDDIGFTATKVTNGPMAFEQLQQRPINFILLDLSLPHMNGFEIYARLQANPATKNIPVILATAWDDDANLKKAAEIGVHHHLTKPFTEDQLLDTIYTMLVEQAKQNLSPAIPQPS